MNGEEYPSQAWRTPLRGGLDVLAAGLHAIFEREGRAYFDDPWAARDAHIQDSAPSAQRLVRARELLEMEHDALRMYSSCAWFFDDIAGLEPRQVLRYAAHACDLAAAGDATLHADLENALLAYLARAKSNDADAGTGLDVYERHVRPRIDTDTRTAAAAAAAHALGIDPDAAAPRAYDVHVDGDRVVLRHVRTGQSAQLQAQVGSGTDQLDVHVRVMREGAAGSALVHLTDFPERARRMIRASLRHKLLTASLTTAELAELAHGDATLRDLAARVLVRSIEELPVDEAGVALRRAHSMLDLLDQLETSIPFDAQTAWWRLRASINGQRATQIAALGVRLGFEVAMETR